MQKNGKEAGTAEKWNSREERFWENLQKARYHGFGAYEIPRPLKCETCMITRFVPFSEAKKVPKELRKETGIHFYIDDFRFERVWHYPDIYVPMFREFGAVLTPDFSCYGDFPKAIKLYAFYRNAWLGCYWQENGITVVPQASWSSPETLSYAFDGIPEDSVLAVSSVGVMKREQDRQFFLQGYHHLIETKHPLKILFHGRIPDEISRYPVQVVQMATFLEGLRSRAGTGKR